MPANLRMTADEFDEISELDFYDYLGRREADLKEPDEWTQRVKKACELLKLQHFKYLRPIGMAMHWNVKVSDRLTGCVKLTFQPRREW